MEIMAYELWPCFEGRYMSFYYDWRKAMHLDYMTAQQSGKWGVLDRDGNVVIAAEYDFITSFSGGIAMTVMKTLPNGRTHDYGGFVGLVNNTGKVILEPDDYRINSRDGFAVLTGSDNYYSGVIDYDGTRYNFEDIQWESKEALGGEMSVDYIMTEYD